MRSAIAGVALVLLATTIWPLVQGRVMTDAPGWAWRLVYLACVVIGLVIAVFSNPVWARVSKPGDHPVWGLGVTALAGAILFGATWWVFIGSKQTGRFQVAVTATIASRPPGTRIDGIAWRDPYALLQVNIKNAAKLSADRVEIFLSSDHPVAKVAQASNLLDVRILALGAMVDHMSIVDPDTGNARAVPISLLATETGYKIEAPSIPANQTLRLTVATVTGFVTRPINGLIDKTYVYPQSMEVEGRFFRKGTHTSWYGFPDHPDAIYTPQALPKLLDLKTIAYYGDDRIRQAFSIPVLNFEEEAARRARQK